MMMARASWPSGRAPTSAAPSLKSRPGAQDYFNQSGESEEAKAYKLTERIGERIDTALEQKVFRNL